MLPVSSNALLPRTSFRGKNSLKASAAFVDSKTEQPEGGLGLCWELWLFTSDSSNHPRSMGSTPLTSRRMDSSCSFRLTTTRGDDPILERTRWSNSMRILILIASAVSLFVVSPRQAQRLAMRKTPKEQGDSLTTERAKGTQKRDIFHFTDRPRHKSDYLAPAASSLL
jgi:hypothetical protein